MSSKFLVVEDERDARDVMTRLLTGYGSVTAVGSAEDAISNMSGASYEVAVIDLSLPNMDGFELLQNIREFDQDVHCVAITAFHTPELQQQALQAGFDDYYAKPLDHRIFMNKMDQFK